MSLEKPSPEKNIPAVNVQGLKKIAWQSLNVGDALGEGAFGTVYRGNWQSIDVAIKQLHLKPLPEHLVQDFESEANIMSQCQFPNIVRLYGVCVEPGHYSMIMEYMHKGSLYHVLRHRDEPLPWNPLRWQIAMDIGKGLAFLHSQNVLHRDLKSLNVLLDEKYQAKISDFGLSKIKTESNNSTANKTKSMVGTTRWRAPEIIKGVEANKKASDVYGYGMILWELASRKLPFEEAPDDFIVMGWIMNGKKEKVPDDCPKEFGHVIESCWEEPQKRPEASQILAALEKAKPAPEKNEAPSEPKTYSEKSWHFDPATKAQRVVDTEVYKLVDATEKDKRKVLQFYQHHPVPGYEMVSVRIIYNPSMNHKFALHLAELQQCDKNPAFQAKWPTGQEHENDPVECQENIDWRSKVHQQFKNMARPYQDSDYPAVNLLPVWHGTKKEIVDSICRTGYASLATTDCGFFGKGIYGAHEAEYSYRVYAKYRGVLILNWTASFSAYPVIDGDMSKFVMKNSQGQDVSIGNYSNYDAHFIPVVPESPHDPNEKNYLGMHLTPHFEQRMYINPLVFISGLAAIQSTAQFQRVLIRATQALIPIRPSNHS